MGTQKRVTCEHIAANCSGKTGVAPDLKKILKDKNKYICKIFKNKNVN